MAHGSGRFQRCDDQDKQFQQCSVEQMTRGPSLNTQILLTQPPREALFAANVQDGSVQALNFIHHVFEVLLFRCSFQFFQRSLGIRALPETAEDGLPFKSQQNHTS